MGSFSVSLEKFAVKSVKQAVLATQAITMEVNSHLVFKSPVGDPSKWSEGFKAAGIALGWFDKNYIGGRFRGNWGVQVGSPWGGVIDTVDKTGSATVTKNNTSISRWNGRGSIYITNHLPYSIPLEMGHSKQAPSGMVRITVAEMQNGAAEAVIK